MLTQTERKIFDEILWWSKTEDADFDWMSFRDIILRDHYHEKMNVKDVVFVLRKYFKALIEEPKFETGSASFEEMIFAPANISPFMKGSDDLTLEEVLDSYVYYMLYSFRHSRCDWYRKENDSKC